MILVVLDDEEENHETKERYKDEVVDDSDPHMDTIIL